MELNTRGRYAVMAMADLAKHGDQRSVALSEIAARQELSEAYLGRLFGQLRHAGLVESVRGRSGGYQLALPAEAIFVSQILVAVDEPTRMTRCIAGSDTGCVGEERCLTHGLWAALSRHIQNFLSDVSLRDVINGGPALQSIVAAQALRRNAEGLAAE